MCYPKASTKSATMDCGVPSIGPSCTNSSSGWPSMSRPHRQPPLHRRVLRPPPGLPPPSGSPLSVLRAGSAGRDPVPPPTSKGTPMSHPAGRWIRPCRLITATAPLSRGALAPVRPPLGSPPRAAFAFPPLWPRCGLLAPASTPPHPPDKQTFPSVVRANLLVKRPRLD
jgi:hypothetical protein